MKKESAILALLSGEGINVGFSDGLPVEAIDSPSEDRALSFGQGIISVSVPAREINIYGGGNAGSASISVSQDAIDFLSMVKSGSVATGIRCQIRYFTSGDYWSTAPVLFDGIVSSAKVDTYSNSVDFSIEPNEQNVNSEFPPSRVGDEFRFPNAPSTTFDRVIPVVYGLAKGYAIPAVSFTSSAAGGGRVALCVAGHAVYGSPEKRGYVKIGNNNLGDMTRWYEIKVGSDGLGSTYSYIVVDIDDWDEGVYVIEISGKTSASNERMESLGDIAFDMWMSYSGDSKGYVDFPRIEYARTILNQFTVGFAFTDATQNQTIIDIMVGRFGDLPFSFSAPIGLFGWDATVIPNESSPPSGVLHYGTNIFERGSISISGYNKIQNRFKITYNYDDNFEGNSESITVDGSNSGLCRESIDRYGPSQYRSLSVPDAATPASIGSFISAEVNKVAMPRLSLNYFTEDTSFLTRPLLSVFHVTDEELGIELKPFFLESVSLDVDNGGCILSLRSLASTERTFMGA